MMRSIIQNKYVKAVAVTIFWIAVWQLLYILINKDILIASPLQVLARIKIWFTDYEYTRIILNTILRIFIGFASALIAGISIAVLTSYSAVLRALIKPIIHIVRAIPVASFIILVLLWVKSLMVPSVITFLTVLPIIWENIDRGINQTDKDLLEMGEAYRLSHYKKLTSIYVPSVMPYFAAACSTGLGFAWKSGIAAEVIAVTRQSIGGQIYNSKIYLETADLFAWTFIIIVISLLIEVLMSGMFKRIMSHKR